MFAPLLFALFILVPLIEIGLFITIGQAIGLVPTLLGVLVTALLGSLLIRWQGLSLLRDIQQTLARGQLPGRQLADAMLVGAGGLLLLLPGYFTDSIGLLLLIPAFRGVLYGWLGRHLRVMPGTTPDGGPDTGPRTIDLDTDRWRDR